MTKNSQLEAAKKQVQAAWAFLTSTDDETMQGVSKDILNLMKDSTLEKLDRIASGNLVTPPVFLKEHEEAKEATG